MTLGSSIDERLRQLWSYQGGDEEEEDEDVYHDDKGFYRDSVGGLEIRLGLIGVDPKNSQSEEIKVLRNY